jgi:hypothetical protein
VSLFEHELGVTVPYWHTGQAARAVMRLIWSYLAILEQETGWETYDPQLGRSLDWARDLEVVSGGHGDMSARLPRAGPRRRLGCVLADRLVVGPARR